MKILLPFNSALKSLGQLFVLTSLLIFSHQAHAQGEGQVPDQAEYLALKDFFMATNGGAWYNATNWPSSWPATASSAEFSTWAGVTVANGDVVMLAYNNNNLTGSLPATINQLSQLTHLYVGGNQISGSFPVAVFALSHLQSLDLAYNQFTGPIPSFGSATFNLNRLQIGANGFIGPFPNLGSQTNLEVLAMSSLALDPGPIPGWFANLTMLSQLYINYGPLVGPIPDFIGNNLTHLTDLQLEHNKLNGPIPSSLGNLSNLSVLYLQANELEGPIPASFGALDNLYYLALANNFLTYIPKEIGDMQSLVHFWLDNNHLQGAIPPEMADCPSLGNLSVVNNKLSVLPDLTGLPLSALQLSGNKFKGPVPAWIGTLAGLSYLRLANNQFEGELPASFSGLVNLFELNIENNKFRGPMPDISGWTKLYGLSMANNGFTGDFPECPPSIGVIDAQYNHFTSVPASLFNVTNHYYSLFYVNDIKTIRNLDAAIANGILQPSGNGYFGFSNNQLDFSQINKIKPLVSLVDLPQNEITDIKEVLFTEGGELLIPSRPLAATSTIVWERKNSDGTWSDVTSLSEDPTKATFKRLQATLNDQGDYRWRTTDSQYPEGNRTIGSVSIIAKERKKYALDNLAFQYRYDSRRRMTHKKVPGAGWVYMVYDKRDRLVMTQDGNQREHKQWSYTQYDALNRPIVTGIYTHSTEVTQEVMTGYVESNGFYEEFNGNAAYHGYSNTTWNTAHFSLAQLEPLTVTYYDNYGYRALWGNSYNYASDGLSQLVTSQNVTYTQPANGEENVRVIGQVTGTKTRVLGSDIWLKSATYYDDKYRAIQSITDVHLGGIDRISNLYDFVGKVLASRQTLLENGTAKMIERSFDYDHAGRLINTWHQVGDTGTKILLSKNEYNELGQLVDKKLHSTQADGSDAKQSVDYRYNIRGWLTSINDASLTSDQTEGNKDLFGMNLGYEQPIAGVSTAADVQYNGNISAMRWSSNLGQADLKERGYAFKYDPMNRLKDAFHKEKDMAAVTPGWNSSSAFKEYDLQYDLNGNIEKLNRSGTGGSNQDNLSYTYKGNQLLDVADAGDRTKGFVDGNMTGDDYVYDENGNMTVDRNKEISLIEYNHLNLPRKVIKANGEYLNYTYDATGRKLSQEVFNAANERQKKTDYAGEYYYENDELKFINHEEGRVVMVESNQDGNSQVIYTNNGSTLTGILYSAGQATEAELETLNGQTYIKATNLCLAPCYGASIDLNTIPVSAGETYKVSVKGYSTGPDIAQIMLRSQANPYMSINNFLPQGAANEAVTEVTFTIPQGVEDLLVSLVWYQPGSEAGQTLHINYITLVRIEQPSTAAEYQYHHKDHLGNVRLTFTTKEDIEISKATMEDEKAAEESSKFLKYDEAETVNQPIFDHTHHVDPAVTTNKSIRLLGGSPNAMYGLEKTLSVMPGDVVDMKVYVKYLDTNEANWSGAIQNLMLSIANSNVGANGVIDGGSMGAAGVQGLNAGPVPHPEDNDGLPMAYMNYVVYGRDIDGPALDMGFAPITTAAMESGLNGLHEELQLTITIKEPGYVKIYLSNESPEPTEVYYDDFTVTHTKSQVIQTDDYYPFGQTFNSYSRENSVPNMYQYNGKEKQNELGLDWLDYGARMYQPELGRWNTVDNSAERDHGYSPYVYAFNNPVRYLDPDGNWPWESKHIRQARRFARETGGTFSKNGNTANVDIYQTATYYETIDGYVEAVYPDGYPQEGLTFTDENNIGLIKFEEGGNYDDLFGPLALEANLSLAQLEEVILIFPGLAELLPDGGSRNTIDIRQLVALIVKMSTKDDNNKPTRTERLQQKKQKKQSSSNSRYGNEAEHTKNRTGSNKQTHEGGKARKNKDKGGEKADSRRHRTKDSKKRTQ